VAADPITCTNPNAMVRAIACVDKDEQLYERTILPARDEHR
jgi:hypothetical protein